MADRTVSVRLRADIAQYQRAMAQAAAGTSATGKEIDKLSGRLRLFTDIAVGIGPALIPLSAGAIPALTGALTGLGAAAGAIGTSLLAFNGMGDALKAIDKARLEPTTENLREMQVALEELGPAGEDFARYLSNLGPMIDDLQDTARSGLFPGLKDGIDSLITRGPEVERIISQLSKGMGDLARDAGRSLSSDDWDPFFRYVEQTARPTLEDFGRATGNVALGVANMLVAFGPLSSSFTGGLVDATRAFADWSAELDSNESFQEFLDYVAKSGPQVVDFLAATAQALAGLVQAAAPMGQVVLPALTGVAKAFAAIASSPIGPGLYTAAAALTIFNRAAVVAEKSSARFSKTWAGLSRAQMATGAAGGLALLASSLTDVDDKAGLANTTLGASAGLMVGGPWGLAIGAAVGQVLDLKAAYDDAAASIDAADDAMRDNNFAAMRDELKGLQDQLAREHPEDGTLANYMDAVIGSFHDFTGQSGEFRDRVAALQGDLRNTGDVADLFGETIGQTGEQMRVAAGDATALSGALATLNGWFDKREAVRGYKDAVDDLRESLKNGFTREDAASLDTVGRSILQVAEGMGSDKKRGEFLAGARESLLDIARNGGPKAKAAVQEVVDKFDALGLTQAEPKITADDKRARATVNKLKGDLDIMGRSTTEPTIAADDNPFRQTYGTVKGAMREADRLRADPTIAVDAGNSLGLIGQISRMLSGLDGRTANTYVRVNRIGGGSVTSSAGGHSSTPAGESAPPPKPGRVAGRVSGRSATGSIGPLDVYTSARGNAAAAKAELYSHRADDAAADSEDAAEDVDHTTKAVAHAGREFVGALKALKTQLDRSQKALEKERQARDNAQAAFDSFASSVGGAFSSKDPFAALSGSGWSSQSPLSAFDAALASNTANTQAAQMALGTASGNGLNGPLYEALAQSGNLQLVQAFAGLSAAEIEKREQAFAAQSAAQAGLGQQAAITAGYKAALDASEKKLDDIRDEVRELRRDVKVLDKNNQQGHKDNADWVAAGVNGAASNGHRRGHR